MFRRQRLNWIYFAIANSSFNVPRSNLSVNSSLIDSGAKKKNLEIQCGNKTTYTQDREIRTNCGNPFMHDRCNTQRRYKSY